MAPDLSPATSSGRFPRLLIAEKNISTVESLIRTFGDRRLDVDFDICASPRTAVRMLLTAPYQLIISQTHLAEIDEFLLLKRTQALETSVPLVVTADASETESARRVLGQGAFDLLTTPLDQEQAVSTIRLAIWHNKLATLIASKERALEKYRDHMLAYPLGNEMDEVYKRTLSAVEASILTYEQSILRIEESTVCFSDFATKVAYHARKRALERLDALPK